MKKYDVKIREILEMTVTVEAASAAQAREIVERDYKRCDYVLNADHFTGVTFTIPPQKNYERQ